MMSSVLSSANLSAMRLQAVFGQRRLWRQPAAMAFGQHPLQCLGGLVATGDSQGSVGTGTKKAKLRQV